MPAFRSSASLPSSLTTFTSFAPPLSHSLSILSSGSLSLKHTHMHTGTHNLTSQLTSLARPPHGQEAKTHLQTPPQKPLLPPQCRRNSCPKYDLSLFHSSPTNYLPFAPGLTSSLVLVAEKRHKTCCHSRNTSYRQRHPTGVKVVTSVF